MEEKKEDSVITKTVTVINNKKLVYNISRGEQISPDNPLYEILVKCNVCDIQQFCGKYKKGARCYFQIENIKAQYSKQKSITSGNPLDLLADIQTNINKLEELINYNEVKGHKNKKSDLKDLAFLKLQVYEMIYGKKQPLAVAIGNIDAPQLDIKSLMAQLRKKEASEVVDAESVEVKEEGEKDELS